VVIKRDVGIAGNRGVVVHGAEVRTQECSSLDPRNPKEDASPQPHGAIRNAVTDLCGSE
jgi:hypothetical protein